MKGDEYQSGGRRKKKKRKRWRTGITGREKGNRNRGEGEEKTTTRDEKI